MERSGVTIPVDPESRESAIADLLRDVRRIEVQSKRLVNGVMAGGYSSVFRGSGVEFDEVREYEEGDDPRTVDWNVTARVGRPYVKKFIDERELTVQFLVDRSLSMDGGFGYWSMRETAARVVACLALSAVRNNDLVSMIGFDSKVQSVAPPRKGVSHALRIVRDCLAQPSSAGGTGALGGTGGERDAGSDASGSDLAPPLEMAAGMLRRRSVMFVISDYLVRPNFEDALRRAARTHDVIAVRLTAPESDPDALADLGLVRVRDPETGKAAVVDFGNAAVRAAHAERLKKARDEVDAALVGARVDRMEVPVPRERVKDAVARPILEFFRMRELRGEKR